MQILAIQFVVQVEHEEKPYMTGVGGAIKDHLFPKHLARWIEKVSATDQSKKCIKISKFFNFFIHIIFNRKNKNCPENNLIDLLKKNGNNTTS